MRYAVGLPNVGDYGDPCLLVDLARQAEAARWDGVFPTHAGIGHADTMAPAQLDEIVRYTRSRRPAGLVPLDVVVEGHSGGRDQAADSARVAALEAVGLTWWVEKLGWFHGPVATARQRVQAGPTRP
jgi:hypothetical protein